MPKNDSKRCWHRPQSNKVRSRGRSRCRPASHARSDTNAAKESRMDTDRITDLVASVSALMERFERRTQQIEGSLQAAHRQLHELSQQLPETLRRAADTEM